jgi:hypothetical protein
MQRIRVVQMFGQSGAIKRKTFGRMARGDGARNLVNGLTFLAIAYRGFRARNY